MPVVIGSNLSTAIRQIYKTKDFKVPQVSCPAHLSIQNFHTKKFPDPLFDVYVYGSIKRELGNTRTKDKNKTKQQQWKHTLLSLYGEPPHLFLGRGQVHLCSLPSELWLLAIWKRALRSKFFLFQTLRYWLIPRNLPFQVSRVFSPCQTKFQNFLGSLGSFTAVTGLRCPFREKHSWSYLACEALDYQLVCVFLMVLCSQRSSKCC